MSALTLYFVACNKQDGLNEFTCGKKLNQIGVNTVKIGEIATASVGPCIDACTSNHDCHYYIFFPRLKICKLQKETEVPSTTKSTLNVCRKPGKNFLVGEDKYCYQKYRLQDRSDMDGLD